MIEVIFVGVVFVVSQIVRDIVCGGKKFGVMTPLLREPEVRVLRFTGPNPSRRSVPPPP
jgi:hypothetical protein